MENRQYQELEDTPRITTTADKRKDKTKEKRKKRTRRIITIILIILLLLFLLLFLSERTGIIPNPFKPVIQNGKLFDEEDSHNKADKKYVIMPVCQSFSVSKKKPAITIYSPVENKDKFYLYYTFSDAKTGKVIYKSNALSGGFKYSVNFKKLLPVGKHEVIAHIGSVYVDDGKKANGTNSKISITVE